MVDPNAQTQTGKSPAQGNTSGDLALYDTLMNRLTELDGKCTPANSLRPQLPQDYTEEMMRYAKSVAPLVVASGKNALVFISRLEQLAGEDVAYAAAAFEPLVHLYGRLHPDYANAWVQDGLSFHGKYKNALTEANAADDKGEKALKLKNAADLRNKVLAYFKLEGEGAVNYQKLLLADRQTAHGNAVRIPQLEARVTQEADAKDKALKAVDDWKKDYNKVKGDHAAAQDSLSTWRRRTVIVGVVLASLAVVAGYRGYIHVGAPNSESNAEVTALKGEVKSLAKFNDICLNDKGSCQADLATAQTAVDTRNFMVKEKTALLDTCTEQKQSIETKLQTCQKGSLQTEIDWNNDQVPDGTVNDAINKWAECERVLKVAKKRANASRAASTRDDGVFEY